MITRTDVLEVLSQHCGKIHGITCPQIVEEVTGHLDYDPVSERRVREIVVELRMEGYAICALPGAGYFIAESADELDATCRFLIDRAMCSLKQVSKMKGIAMPDLYEQLHVPT